MHVTRSPLLLPYVVALLLLGSHFTLAQWTLHAVADAADVSTYAQATVSRSYCIADGRLYQRENTEPWQLVDQFPGGINSPALFAWNDTVVVSSTARSASSQVIHYSTDAGETWHTHIASTSGFAIVPRTTTYVSVRRGADSLLLFTRVSFVTGDVSQRSLATPTESNPVVVAGNDCLVVRKRRLSSSPVTHEIVHVTTNAISMDDWTVRMDTSAFSPFRIPGGSVGLRLDDRAFLHIQGASVDTVVIPEGWSWVRLEQAGIVHNRGRWMARVVVNQTTVVATSVDGRSWSAFPHAISRTAMDSVGLAALNGSRVVSIDSRKAVTDFDAQRMTMTLANQGLSHRGRIASDDRHVAVMTSSATRDSLHIHAFDDAAGSVASQQLMSIKTGTVRGFGVYGGIVWAATDSIYATDVRTGLRLNAIAPPAAVGRLRVTKNGLLWIRYDAVWRRDFAGVDWRQLVGWSSGLGDGDVFVLDAFERGDYLYLLDQNRPSSGPYPVNRLWRYRANDRNYPSVIVQPMAIASLFFPDWRIEDLGYGIAHTEQGEVVAIADYDAATTFDLLPHRHARIHNGRIWLHDSTSMMYSHTSDGQSKQSYTVPLFPPHRRISTWFCLEKNCYINTDAGLYSAPYLKGATGVVPEASGQEFVMTTSGRLLVPHAGQLTVMDVQGRVISVRAVESGEYVLDNVASGVYCAILTTTSGITQRLVFIR